MKSSPIAIQLVAIVMVTLALMSGVAAIGLRGDGLAAELTASALDSPAARQEMAAAIAEDFAEAAPILGEASQLEGPILTAINSPLVERALPTWLEHGVRFRLGEDVGPLLIKPSDVITNPNPLINAGIEALPAVPVTLRSKKTDSIAPALQLAAPLLAAATLALIAFVRTRFGLAPTLLIVGCGGMLATAGLLALRLAAQIAGALSTIVTSAVISSVSVAVVAGLALVTGVLGVLAPSSS